MKYDKIVAMNQEKSRKKVDVAKREIEKMLERKERICYNTSIYVNRPVRRSRMAKIQQKFKGEF